MIQRLLTAAALTLALVTLALLVLAMEVMEQRLDRIESAPPTVEQGQKRA